MLEFAEVEYSDYITHKKRNAGRYGKFADTLHKFMSANIRCCVITEDFDKKEVLRAYSALWRYAKHNELPVLVTRDDYKIYLIRTDMEVEEL